MITAEDIKQAKQNIDKLNGLYHVRNSFHFKSFAIGLVVGLTICATLLIVII